MTNHQTVSFALASGVVAALVPKCPLCVAAYVGVGVGTASVAVGVLRPLGFALAVLALVFSLIRRNRKLIRRGMR